MAVMACVLPISLVLGRPAAGGSAGGGAGSLDEHFGVGGEVTTHFPGSLGDAGMGLVVQRDSTLVAAGTVTSEGGVIGYNNNFGLARYDRDGSLDTRFGSAGTVTTDFGDGTQDYAEAIVMQRDGKLVVAGATASPFGGNVDFGLARYDRDGSLDTSFGTGGIVTTDLGGGNDYATALAVQPDGRLVAAGFVGGATFALVRYDRDGSLDTSFGTGGIVSTGMDGQGQAVAVQADRKLVVAGSASDDFGLVRYNPDGSPDPTFGTGGIVTTDFTGNVDAAYALAVQPDGRLLAAGFTVVSLAPFSVGFGLARYNRDGSLDTTFGVNGKVTTTLGGFDTAYAVVALPDGRLVAGGASHAAGGLNFGLARYDRHGSLDTTFGSNGMVTTTFNGAGAGYVNALALQPNGKLVAAGVNAPGPSISGGDFALARYLM
jgi:uncharacterized delta-60 repeat protein